MPDPRHGRFRDRAPLPTRVTVGIVALATAALVLVASACSGPRHEAPPIILVVVDTLRPDHLGLYGYDRPTSPHLDRWAENAAVFERAFSTSPWTLPSFGSLYTGRIPTRHGAGIIVRGAAELPPRDELDRVVERQGGRFVALDPSTPTLAERLRRHGYSTGAVINNPFLDPEFGVDRGFDTYDYRREVGPRERTADEAVDRALEWIDGNGARPFFLVLHLIDPHMPYDAPEPFRGRFGRRHADALAIPETRDDIFDLREEIQEDTRHAAEAAALHSAAYDEEIAFVDHELDRFFAGLDERGILDEALLVLTSDHGEEFHEHGWFEHGHSVHDELLRVPLLVWGPAVRPGRVETAVSLVDVAPTVLDVSGAASTGGPGSTLVPLLRERATRPPRLLFAERTLYGVEQKAVIQWPLKVIWRPGEEASLYDLERDPGETVDIAAREEELVTLLTGRLVESVEAAERRVDVRPVELDAATLERLRALGYLR